MTNEKYFDINEFKVTLINKLYEIVKSEKNETLSQDDINGFVSRRLKTSIDKTMRKGRMSTGYIQESIYHDTSLLLANNNDKITNIIKLEVMYYDKSRGEN